MLKIPIVHADSVSKSLRQKFLFSRERPLLARGKNNIFRDNYGANRDLAHQSQDEDNFPTFSLGLEFLNEAEKEKNNGKGDSASAPSRFMITANNHFWYCCPFFASDLMHNSTGHVIKQLVHALKKLELPSAIASGNSYASFVLSKLPTCSITQKCTLKHEPIVNWQIWVFI